MWSGVDQLECKFKVKTLENDVRLLKGEGCLEDPLVLLQKTVKCASTKVKPPLIHCCLYSENTGLMNTFLIL